MNVDFTLFRHQYATDADYNRHVKAYIELVEKVTKVNPEAGKYLSSRDVEDLPTFTLGGDLSEIFYWGDSPQGFDYWDKICEQLGGL